MSIQPRSAFMTTLAARARTLVDGPVREGGAALLTTVLFMLMLSGLSLVMLSVLLGQIQPALAAQQSTRSVYSAQAGLQAALGVIRTAAGTANAAGEVFGSLRELPCTLRGSADGADDALSYDVRVRYFTAKPSTTTDPGPGMPCTAAGGVTGQPRYALVTSRGAATAEDGSLLDEGDRTISALYEFNLTNVNIPGGMIFNFANTHCLRAAGTTAGAKVQYQAAASCDRDDRELWIYEADWRVKLASSTVAGATPLCVTGPVNASDTNNQDTILQPCRSVSDAARWNQLFTWDTGEKFQGQRSPVSAGASAYCLGPENTSNLTNTDLQVKRGGTCASFNPTPQVGAGAASFDTTQIVNFREFGRCTDVTDQKAGHPFMIVYPCKQDPTSGNGPTPGANINWNHKWKYTEPANRQGSVVGQISILVENNSGDRRCLTTPASTSTSRYVTFSTCSGSQVRQQWTRFAQEATYEQSWLFVDNQGRCLTADSADQYRGFSKITVTTCNGTETQKWNAPANSSSATFGGYREVVG